jgi:hypothetical protein
MVSGVGPAAGTRVPRPLVVAGAIGTGLLVLSLLVDFVFFAGRDVTVKDIPQLPGLPSLPTNFPSGFPTSLPSGFPTELPSGFPTELPSGFPSGVPLPTGVPGFPQPTGTP